MKLMKLALLIRYAAYDIEGQISGADVSLFADLGGCGFGKAVLKKQLGGDLDDHRFRWGGLAISCHNRFLLQM